MSEASGTEIDTIIASQPNWKGKKLAELRSIILSTSGEVSEDVRWKMPSKPLGSPTWEASGILCVADYLKSAVRLTFPKGAQISDPSRLFNARLDSKVARAIDFSEDMAVDSQALKGLILHAIELNK
jgi:hypothetical protein